jgi:hypothetical protein
VEGKKTTVSSSSSVVAVLGIVMGSGGGVAFVNLIQMVQFILLLNVNLPQNFYDFLSIFAVKILDFNLDLFLVLFNMLEYDRS